MQTFVACSVHVLILTVGCIHNSRTNSVCLSKLSPRPFRRLDLSGNYDQRLSCRSLRISERGRSAIIDSVAKLHKLKRFELLCDLRDPYEVRDTELEEYHSKLRHIPDVRVDYAEA